MRQRQISGDRPRVFHHRADAARVARAHNQHAQQRRHHYHGLNEIGYALGQETAQHGIQQHKGRAHQHHTMVGHIKQPGKELAAGNKAAGGVHGKENQDKYGRYAQNDLLFFMKTIAEEIRHGNGIASGHRIAAQAARYQQPVQVRAQRQANRRPASIRQAAPVGQARHAHEQISAHIRSLGAHGGYPWSQRAPTQEIAFSVFVGSACKQYANGNNHKHITRHND